MKLLMLSVGEGRYALPADAVNRIVDPALEGGLRIEDDTTVIGGERLPLFDLHALAGEPRGPRPVYLVLHGVRCRSVVAVDDAEAIREVAAGGIAPLPRFIFPGPGGPFRGVFEDGSQPRLLLDPEELR